MDDELTELRSKLLESDSESDSDDTLNEGAAGIAAVPGRASATSPAGQFDWASLGDSESSAVGPNPPRQLRDRNKAKEELGIMAAEPQDARRYSRAEKVRGRRSNSSRRGLGVQSANRLAAGSNYASPDDELLI